MSEYRYDLIEHAKDKVKRYYDDLETLLAWLLAMASSDFPDGWAYLLKDEDGNETWTNSKCIAIGITSPIQLRLF